MLYRFSLGLLLLALVLPLANASSCRDQILASMCLVDPLADPNAPSGEADQRACLAGGAAYAHFFEELYDHYPPAFQKMFCSVKKIFIENQFFGTAYGGLLYDASGKPIGAKIGIRKSALDEGLSLSAWASWKDQLSFGASPQNFALPSSYPKFVVTAPPGVNDFLYFVIAHELGHIFDFANHLNQTVSCEQDECVMEPASWGGISWQTSFKTWPEDDFLERTGLCFYSCGTQPLQPAQVASVYQHLEQTSFISLYSTTQPYDDFAESLAYFLMSEALGATITIETAPGQIYDPIRKLKAPLFKKKYQFIESFLKRTDIVYP